MCQTGLKTGDLDLKLQGQIGLETKNFCVIRGKIPTFPTLTFKVKLAFKLKNFV